jgi:glutathione S-transferase
MNQHTLILHQYQVSPFAAKVRRVCYFKNIPFETHNYGLTKLSAVKKISPSGKLPALQVGERIVVDSTDIVACLEEQGGEPVFPAEPGLRALAHIIEDWADESLYFYDLTMRTWSHNVGLLAEDLTLEESGFMKKIFRRLIPSAVLKQAKGQGIARKSHAEVCRDVERHFDAVDDLLKNGDFLVGDKLSIADISVVSMCTVLDRADEAREMMAARPALQAWRERVDELTLPAGTAPFERALV